MSTHTLSGSHSPGRKSYSATQRAHCRATATACWFFPETNIAFACYSYAPLPHPDPDPDSARPRPTPPRNPQQSTCSTTPSCSGEQPGQTKTPLRLLIKRQENIISKFPYKNQRAPCRRSGRGTRGMETETETETETEYGLIRTHAHGWSRERELLIVLHSADRAHVTEDIYVISVCEPKFSSLRPLELAVRN